MEKRNSNVASTNKAKTRITISEDDYVAFYLSQNLVEDWDAEEFAGVLKNWYKTLRNAEALDTEEGKEFTDYVAEEVENAPISEVFNSDNLFFAYFAKKQLVKCLNDEITIETVPEGQQSNAIVLAQALSQSYGSLWLTYEQLLNEFENLR